MASPAEPVFSGGCRGESCVALCFGKIQVVGRKGEGEEGGVAAGPVWRPSVLGDAGMKGWALAALLDPGIHWQTHLSAGALGT